MEPCVLHYDEEHSKTLVLECISEKKWTTIVECASRWVNIACAEKKIAEKILKVLNEDLDQNVLGLHCSRLQSQSQCHIECYRKFTSRRRIEQGEQRHPKCEPKQTEALRPKREKDAGAKASAILPDVCLVCREKLKWTLVRHGV